MSQVGFRAVQVAACIGLGFATWNGGTRLAAERQRMAAPCVDVLDAYTHCMDAHAGQAPEPYEDEFCLAEGESYRLCRTGEVPSGANEELDLDA